MKILTLHEEKVLEELESSLKQADKKAEIHAFTKSEDAIAFLKENKVDAAFVGYRVEDKKPEELFEMLDAAQKDINVIFITGWNGGQVSEELAKKVSGVMGRPFMGNDARRELDNLLHPVAESMHERFVGTC